ncbi:hypothetical protein P7C70_g3624, partial [Phenoliferia sp. Uapishka_3]
MSETATVTPVLTTNGQPRTNGEAKARSLPAFTEVQKSVLTSANAVKVSQDWLGRLGAFAKKAAAGDVSGAGEVFLEDGVYILLMLVAGQKCLDLGQQGVPGSLQDYHSHPGEGKNLYYSTELHCLALHDEATFGKELPEEFKIADPSPEVNDPYPDIGFIQTHFTFKTKMGTVLEGLRDFPELERPNGRLDGVTSWSDTRARNVAFEESDPDVVIVGAGHNGLVLAARHQQLGVEALCIEMNAKPGDFWRQRYEALSLHFPGWQDHLPYIPFPKQWPIYTPAAEVGNFLSCYADCIDLLVWTSSKVTSAKFDATTKRWTVQIERKGLGTRELKPRHFVVATGLAGASNIPKFEGIETFTGKITHSSQHDSAKHWKGKKILVVGSSSGFDAAYDTAKYGVDATMLQKSPTYVMSLTHGAPAVLGHIYSENGPTMEVADRIAQSMPTYAGEALRLYSPRHSLGSRSLNEYALVTCLRYTPLFSDHLIHIIVLDCGATDPTVAVIDGRIKIKQGTITRFDGDEVVFNDGSVEHYNLVILATGYGPSNESSASLLGQDVGAKLKPVWGLVSEGELNGAWRYLGVDNLWAMVGTFGWARFHSKVVASRIKADLEGISGEMYLD